MISLTHALAKRLRIAETSESDHVMFLLRVFVTAAAFPVSIFMLGIALVNGDTPLIGYSTVVFLIFVVGRTRHYAYLSYIIGFLVPLMMTTYGIKDVIIGPRDITGSVIWLIIPVFIASNWVSLRGTLAVTFIQLLGVLWFVYIVAPDGMPITSQLLARPLGFVILGSIAITSPVFGFRQARNKLEKSEKELRRLYQNLPVGIYRTSPDGFVLQANPSAVEITGYQTEAELVSTLRSVETNWYVDPNQRDVFLSEIQKNGFVDNLESRVWRDGEVIWVSESAYPVYNAADELVYYEGAIQDITQRKAAEERVDQTLAQLRMITDNIPAWVAYVDEDRKFQFANRFFETRVGIPEGWLIGKHVRAFVGEEFWQRTKSQVDRIYQGEPLVIEVPGQTYSGEALVTRVTHVPHFTEDGTVRGYFLLGLDITEQRQAEQTIRQLHKVESLGMVAGGVAHDFNNLLTGIMAQSSIALRKLEKGHKSIKHIERALSSSRSAERLVKQLLAYSGDEHLNSGNVDLNALIEQALQNVSFSTGQLINVKTSLSNQIPHIWADDIKVEQILLNLITNGSQAIEAEQGEIIVETKLDYIHAGNNDYARLTGENLAPGEYILLTVADNGCGIAEDKLLQIFDPFYSTKFSGHGLGLAAVLGTMRAHLGGISVQSELGKGTTFTLVFPAEHPLAITNSHQAKQLSNLPDAISELTT